MRVNPPQAPEFFAGFGRGGFLNAGGTGLFEEFFKIGRLGTDAGGLAVHFDDHLRLAGREFCGGTIGPGGIQGELVGDFQSRREEAC